MYMSYRPPIGMEYNGKSRLLDAYIKHLLEKEAELKREVQDFRTPLEKSIYILAASTNNTMGIAMRLFSELQNTQAYKDLVDTEYQQRGDSNPRVYTYDFIYNYLMSLSAPSLITFAWCFNNYLSKFRRGNGKLFDVIELTMRNYLEIGKISSDISVNVNRRETMRIPIKVYLCQLITDYAIKNLDLTINWVDKDNLDTGYDNKNIPDWYLEKWNIEYGLRTNGYGSNENDWHTDNVTGFQGSKYDKFIKTCITRDIKEKNDRIARNNTTAALTQMVPKPPPRPQRTQQTTANKPIIPQHIVDQPMEYPPLLHTELNDLDDFNDDLKPKTCFEETCERANNFVHGVTQRVTGMIGRKQKISGGKRRTRRHKKRRSMKKRQAKRRNSRRH